MVEVVDVVDVDVIEVVDVVIDDVVDVDETDVVDVKLVEIDEVDVEVPMVALYDAWAITLPDAVCGKPATNGSV